MTKLACLVVGWNPKVLKNCEELSFAMLKKYVAAITIMSIIWGVIGWYFADNYLGIKSWYGKTITSIFFIAVIVSIERYIILSHGNFKLLVFFRIFLAFLMAVLGSTIFDQIVFKNDIKVQMKDIRTEQINKEIPKRTIIIDNQIIEISKMIDSISAINNALYEELIKTPVIIVPEVTTTRRQIGRDETGRPIYESDRTVTQRSVPNPKTEQAQQNDILLNKYREQVKSLNANKLNIADDVRTEYEQASTGFLEELGALYTLLTKNGFVLAFYIFLFLFLMCLELLVLTTKGSDKCDYELLIDFQLETKKKELKI